MDYKKYMGKMDKIYGTSSNPYQSGSGFESGYNRKVSRPESPSNVYYPPQPPMINTTPGQPPMINTTPSQGQQNIDAMYSNMFGDKTFSSIYNQMLQDNKGNKDEAKKSTLKLLRYIRNFIYLFDPVTGEDSNRAHYSNRLALPEFRFLNHHLSGRLADDRKRIDQLYSQMRSYMGESYA